MQLAKLLSPVKPGVPGLESVGAVPAPPDAWKLSVNDGAVLPGRVVTRGTALVAKFVPPNVVPPIKPGEYTAGVEVETSQR